jgi:hypothetical protein
MSQIVTFIKTMDRADAAAFVAAAISIVLLTIALT